MEKKYCKYCNNLTAVNGVCEKCGHDDFQSIIISVQSNPDAAEANSLQK